MITQMIFDWAKRTPQRPAIIHNGESWSYHAFAQLIAAARGYFVRRGYIGPGYAVLAFDNLLDFWILSLALRSLGLTSMAVGGATAPGQADLPNMRKLGLQNVRCVITNPGETTPEFKGLCTELELPLVSVSLTGEPELAPDAFETPQPLGDHILLTSGTTGIHKMVRMSSTDDADLLRLHVKLFGISQESLLSVFNFGAWTGLFYKWAASTWSVGGGVVIEQAGEPYRALIHPEITHAVLNPGTLASILAAPASAFPRNDKLKLAVGAGAVTRPQVDQAKARITPHLFNYIASTEAGVIAFTSLDTPDDLRWHRLVPGRAVEIVDESDRALPAGKIGRLRVGTAGGPTSYLRDEAATRAFFKAGFFYSGDLAAMRSDGRMALQGRVTDVINMRGEKISPAPIEERLCELLGCSGICIFSRQNDSGEEEIHVVIEAPAPIDSYRLADAIKQELNGFHRAFVHYLATLPRNRMGKVLRQAVQAQVLAEPPPSAPTR